MRAPRGHAVEGRERAGSRSAVVSQAIEEWLATHAEPSEEDRRYVQAYLRRPERVAELSSVAAAATCGWEPWE